MTLQRTFVVNLVRRPEKKRRLLERLRAIDLGAPVEWFRAVDGLELGPAYLDAHGFALYRHWKQPGATNPYHARDLKWGEVGCALSHLLLWRRMVEEDIDTALILEDDTTFTPGAAVRLHAALAAVEHHDREWDLCYAGRVRLGATAAEPIVGPGVVVPTFSYCTHAYVLSNRGARKLLSTGFERAIFPVDELLPALYDHHPRADIRALLAAAPRMRTYAIDPSLVAQEGAPSDIEGSSAIAPALREVQWSPGKRTLERRLRPWGVEGTLRVETEREVLALPIDRGLTALVLWMVQRERFAIESAAAECGADLGVEKVAAVVSYLAGNGILAWARA